MTAVLAAPAAICVRSVDFRASSEAPSDGRTLEGYAAVFDTPARIDSWEGTFDEQIARSAFRKTLRARTPVLQFDHGRDFRTGSVPIGSMQELREDAEGLFVSARMFDNPVVEPIRQAIEGGAISGMSFRFQVIRDEWRDVDGKLVKADELAQLLYNPGERGPLKRTIKEVDLFELGPVVFPAYDSTSVGVRSLLAQISGDERAALIHEVVSRIQDLTGRPGLQETGGGDRDADPDGEAAHVRSKNSARHASLILEGVIR